MGSLRSLRTRDVEPIIVLKPSDEELIQAICSGTIKQVKALLAQGANPNAVDSYSDTALGYAAHLGKLRMAQLLLKNGADVNQKGHFGRAPLTIAVTARGAMRQKICLFLLNHGANVNTVNSDGTTPLMTAVRYQEFDLAKLLLLRGADATLRNCDGKRALDLLRRGKGSKALGKFLEPVS